MLNPRLTGCRTCADISNLLKIINCKIAEEATKIYHNITLLLNKPIDGCVIDDLVKYKRILMYKQVNEDYASDFSLEKIASKIREKTVSVNENFVQTVGKFTTTVAPESICVRPPGLPTWALITGYVLTDSSTTVSSTSSLQDSCAAVNMMLNPPASFSSSHIDVKANALEVGQSIYLDNGSTDCETISDGWYFTFNQAVSNTTIHIVDGVVTEVASCSTS